MTLQVNMQQNVSRSINQCRNLCMRKHDRKYLQTLTYLVHTIFPYGGPSPLPVTSIHLVNIFIRLYAKFLFNFPCRS